MGARTAWLLNFGAEAELENPSKVLDRATRARGKELLGHLSALIRPGDLVLWDEPSEEGSAMGALGYAWMPTPRALAALRRAGARTPETPSYEVLRAVNDRRFSVGLGNALEGQTIVQTMEELVSALSTRPEVNNWLLRRPFGFAGRGRRRARLDEVFGPANAWIEASLRSFGALVVEPWVERMADFGLHGFLMKNGQIVLGEPTVQEMKEDGAWLATRLARPGELGRDEERALFRSLVQAGEALFAAGYFGPFGVDAFRYRDTRGREHWNARSEINARYSMGWAIGMRGARPDLLSEDAFGF